MDNASASTQWGYTIDDDDASDVRSITSSSSEASSFGDILRSVGLDLPRAARRRASSKRHYPFEDTDLNDELPASAIDAVGELLEGQQRSESLVKHELGQTSIPAPSSGADRTFPLLKLPKELRLNVFDQLFLDLTEGRQHKPETLNRYRYPNEWPDNDLSAYLHLLLTCKEIHNEARQLWETTYIRQCYFYFWKVPDLYRVACALEKLGEPYTSAKYVLRGRPAEEKGDSTTDFVDEESEELMMYQPGFPHEDPDYADHHWHWLKFPFDGPKGAHYLEPGRIPFEIYSWGPKRRSCARAFYPTLDNCVITVHERRKDVVNFSTRYSQMNGEIGGIFWGAYDAATGHAKLMIFEEWERRGSPDTLLDKASAVIAWKSRAQAGLDERWTELKGSLGATFMAIEDGYLMDHWLRERPSPQGSL